MDKEIRCVALGEDVEESVCVVQPHAEPKSIEQRLDDQQKQIMQLTSALDSMASMIKELRDDYRKREDEKLTKIIEDNKKAHKMEIPEGTLLHGATHGLTFYCTVADGGFKVGNRTYNSLSQAAEGISGVRRSGWTFWRLPDGRTVKEVYKA